MFPQATTLSENEHKLLFRVADAFSANPFMFGAGKYRATNLTQQENMVARDLVAEGFLVDAFIGNDLISYAHFYVLTKRGRDYIKGIKSEVYVGPKKY